MGLGGRSKTFGLPVGKDNRYGMICMVDCKSRLGSTEFGLYRGIEGHDLHVALTEKIRVILPLRLCD